jgi:hypothetical protein
VFRRQAKVVLTLALAALGLFGLTQMASGTYNPTLARVGVHTAVKIILPVGETVGRVGS